MSSILWAAIAIALVIGIIKTTIKLLKFIFTVALIAVGLLFLVSLGLIVI